MNSAGLLKQFAAFDLWANRLFIERLLKEDQQFLDKEVPSSFPSLRATMLHIRNAEYVWLCRLKCEPFSWPAEESMEIESLLRHCTLLHDHVQKLSDEDLEREITYSDLHGNVHQQPAWQLLMHCFNHSTHHRGQIMTMLRVLGSNDIPSNDMVIFQRTLKTKD